MADFAIYHEGMPEGHMAWVLHVDDEYDRLLLVDGEGALYWKRFDECKVMGAHTPANPTAVVLVQPPGQEQGGLVVPQMGLSDPQPNRMTRRNGG